MTSQHAQHNFNQAVGDAEACTHKHDAPPTHTIHINALENTHFFYKHRYTSTAHTRVLSCSPSPFLTHTHSQTCTQQISMNK